jgi:hypothetical protein
MVRVICCRPISERQMSNHVRSGPVRKAIATPKFGHKKVFFHPDVTRTGLDLRTTTFPAKGQLHFAFSRDTRLEERSYSTRDVQILKSEVALRLTTGIALSSRWADV